MLAEQGITQQKVLNGQLMEQLINDSSYNVLLDGTAVMTVTYAVPVVVPVAGMASARTSVPAEARKRK
jgi:hypothetical protein